MSPYSVIASREIGSQRIVIRTPVIDDAAAMCEYINTLSDERTFIRFQGEKMTELQESIYLDGQLSKIEQKQAVLLLAFAGEKSDQLVGISGIDLQDKIESHVGVFGISVAADQRGKGVGKFLLDTILKVAPTALPSMRIITLGVFANNPIAIKMYKDVGFVEYGILPGGVQHREKLVDHIYMYKNV